MVSNVVKQSLMDCESSSTSLLPWTWVVESLACSKEVDASILLDLVKRAPHGSDDVWKNVRELLSLTILEQLCKKQHRSSNASCSASSKIRVDPADRCEDVLQKILHEASDKAIRARILQLDIEPFIANKRSCLPECSLQKLKKAILTGSYAPFSSLKELSGLLDSNQPENQDPKDNGDCIAVKPTPEKIRNLQPCPDKLIHRVLENDGHLSGRNLTQENSFPSMEDDTQNPENETNVEVMRLQNDVCASTKGHSGLGNVLPSEKGSPLDDTEAFIDQYKECGHDSNTGKQRLDQDMEDMEYEKEGLDMGNTTNGSVKLDPVIERSFVDGGGNEVGMSGDSEWFDTEMSDIVAKKNIFLSGQCTLNQDSGMIGCNERIVCVKCNRTGKLLSCSSESCPVVIHQICLGCDACYIGGNFYCPFCSYSRAISKHLETKEHVSLAKKALTAFMSTGTRNGTEGQPHEPCRRKRKHFEQDDDVPRSNPDLEQGKDLLESNKLNDISLAKNGSMRKRKKHLEMKEAATNALDAGGNTPFGPENLVPSDATPHSSEKEKQAVKGKKLVSQPEGVNEETEMVSLPNCSSEDEKAPSKVLETGGDGAETSHKEGVSVLLEADRPREEKGLPNLETAAGKAQSEEESESSKSKYCVAAGKPKKHHLHPALPKLKRKKVAWTEEEEEKLTEEVVKIPDNHSIPWTDILELGAGIFNRTRTAEDLRGKWKNMRKAAEKSKSRDN